MSRKSTQGNGRIAGQWSATPEENPAGGTEVVLLSSCRPGPEFLHRQAAASADHGGCPGDFAFDGLAPGRYRVWANLGEVDLASAEQAKGEGVILPESGQAPTPSSCGSSPECG